jgi:hypothetical protein
MGSLALLLAGIIGGIFSFPGSSRRTFFVRAVLLDDLRFRVAAGAWAVTVGAGSSVSSKTTVAFPPTPSPRRMDGVRLSGARLGAQDERHVVSKEGFCMLFVFGDSGVMFVLTANGTRMPEIGATGMFG